MDMVHSTTVTLYPLRTLSYYAILFYSPDQCYLVYSTWSTEGMFFFVFFLTFVKLCLCIRTAYIYYTSHHDGSLNVFQNNSPSPTISLLGLSPTELLQLLQLLANYGKNGPVFENCRGSENEVGWLGQSCVVC